MKTSRREWMRKNLAVAAITPTLLSAQKARSYKVDEIEKRLGSGKKIRGVTKLDLPTPSLLLDLDRLSANIAKMARYAEQASVELRPHAKTHKCPEVARRQLEAGALGVCTATIHEAEQMAAANIGGLLITSELVGPNKIQRLVRLTKSLPETMSVVDHPGHARQLSEAAAAANVELNILVDIDPIGRRTGIGSGEPALSLAKKVDSLANLNLRGVHGYSGASSHVEGFDARRDHSTTYMTPVLETFAQMKREGLPVEIMSGASTGTYNIDPELPDMTELQVGSYVFMDLDYRRIGGRGGPVYDDFEPSLTVLATVISKNHKDLATLDAGLKAFATDREFGPEVIGVTGVRYRFGGDEHGILELRNAGREIRLGDKIELLVPHCDPNVNLYDRFYCTRGENVEEVWSIQAQGHA